MVWVVFQRDVSDTVGEMIGVLIGVVCRVGEGGWVQVRGEDVCTG